MGRYCDAEDGVNSLRPPWLDGVATVRVHGTLKEGVGDWFDFR